MTIEVLQDASRRVIDAWRRYDEAERELRARYLTTRAGERIRPVDEDAFAAQLAVRARERDAEIATIRSNASRENAQDERSINSRLDRDLGKPRDTEIAAAWADRVKPRLDAGFALDELLAAPGLTRADIESIRANYPSYVAAKVGPDAFRAGATRDEMAEATRRVDAAELGLLGEDVRAAAIEARQRDGAERAMTRALDYDRTRRESRTPMPLTAAGEIELGFGIASDLGVPAHEPGRQDWRQVVAQIDGEAAAVAARNALAPDHRDKLDDNARSVGFDRPPAEPSLTLGEG